MINNFVATQFELPDETGQIRQLSDLMGEKGLLLVFIQGTWCPPCITTLYYLSRNAAALKTMGVNVAVIAMDEAQTLSTFKASASLPINFPLLGDYDNRVREMFQVAMLETYMLLDRNMVIHEAFVDEDGHSRPGVQTLKDTITHHLN